MRGVVTGITITARQPSFCAASATPCAWLPALAAITPFCSALARQPRHLVVRAAQLEREHRLQVLALEEQAVAEARESARRELERRLDRDVVDARLQDPLEIVFFFKAGEFSMEALLGLFAASFVAATLFPLPSEAALFAYLQAQPGKRRPRRRRRDRSATPLGGMTSYLIGRLFPPKEASTRRR